MKLRLSVFNVENLFVLCDEPNEARVKSIIDQDSEQEWQSISVSVIPNKPLQQLKGVARAIREMRADILLLCEIGGLESLRNFSKYFLNDEFTPLLIEGNSDRGIDLGYLVRKSLPFKYDLVSHKHRPIDFLYPHERQSLQTGYANDRLRAQQTHKFSRDVLELRVFTADNNSRPSLVALLVHLKSQLDRDRIDPFGRDRRKAELEKLVKIYSEIVNENASSVPIVLGGDFNGAAAGATRDAEFEALSKTDLREVLELAAVPEEERFTHMQIQPWGNKSVNRQFDCLFVNAPLHSKVSASETKVFRYKDEFGMRVDIPRSLAEKRLLPSDHYPVIAELEI